MVAHAPGPADSKPQAGPEPPGPVMLALSTFRRSERAVDVALTRAAECGRLLVVHVVDVNLARYFIGSDIGYYPELQEQTEKDLLAAHEEDGRRHVDRIAEQARSRGLSVETLVRVGRFAEVCLEVVAAQRPSLIVTTRSHRPAWVKRFFGSPVSRLVEEAGCPVVEA